MLRADIHQVVFSPLGGAQTPEGRTGRVGRLFVQFVGDCSPDPLLHPTQPARGLA